MKNQLSILLPEYNTCCTDLVKTLQRQARNIAGLSFEIIVVDDGSINKIWEKNQSINKIDYCRFIRREKNSGRAIIRNFLAQQAKYPWLLFLDCDRKIISSSFIEKYLEADGKVIYGCYHVIGDPQLCKGNLRYLYEKQAESSHLSTFRQQHPYKNFNTCNFMIERHLIIKHPFDKRFIHYGYEDVAYGKKLQKLDITINHIDNPVGLDIFESNTDYIAKTEESLHTLFAFSSELKGYSTIQNIYIKIKHTPACTAIRLFHYIFHTKEKTNLTSNHPCLWIFKLYRLGYFISIHKFHWPFFASRHPARNLSQQ